MAKLKISGKTTSQPNDVPIAQVDPFVNPETVEITQELDGQKRLLFKGTLTPQGGGSPPVNRPPVIETPSSVTGKVNEEIALIARIADVDGTIDDVNWIQKPSPTVTLTQEDDAGLYTATFTPTQAGVYDFEVEAFDNQNARTAKQVKVTITAEVPPPPPPPTGNIIWSSKRDTKLHDGVVRTITTEGDISPGKLGVECRASGKPKIVVNADKTFSLVSGSGGVDNLSIKVRSRHNEGGGDCSNRFGGFGCSIDKSQIKMKTESCHNNHENSLSKSHGVNVNDGKLHTLEFECKDVGSAVEFNFWLDGAHKMKGAHNNPKSFYLDKALYQKNSYFWLRLNNSDHGRIYVFALNYNSKLKAVFKFEPSKNAITFDDVILEAV